MEKTLETITQCPLCKSKESGLFKRIAEWELRKCVECDLIRLDPRPVSQELKRLYNEEYFNSRSAGDPQRAAKQMNRSFKRRLRLIRRFSNGNTLLDAGCGEGHWLVFVKERGYNVSGFDVSDSAAKRCGLEIKIGAMGDAPVDGTYDIITSFHSLEHTEDPILALSWLSNFLNPDGILVIEVPNCASYDAIKFDNDWDGWKLPFHLWHFTPRTLTAALEKTGFEPVEWRFDSSKWIRTKLRKIPILSLTKGILSHYKTGTGMLVVAKKATNL